MTCPCKVTPFLLLEFELEAILSTVTMHLQLYTLFSYIFVVQSLHKMWFKAYTSLQGTCVLYCGPILQVNGFVRANLVVAGHDPQVVTQHRNFSVQIIHVLNFGYKEQVIFDRRDRK